ncbi:MAG: hypothetical protein A3J76_01715 [Candidatus Moranbacteria bacterium RBG_13_45_13]|nr:MAG: hypothetical protein A3J76_01715 [Candidatus Moranbacteria bacterium RBG_13_45_13]
MKSVIEFILLIIVAATALFLTDKYMKENNEKHKIKNQKAKEIKFVLSAVIQGVLWFAIIGGVFWILFSYFICAINPGGCYHWPTLNEIF